MSEMTRETRMIEWLTARGAKAQAVIDSFVERLKAHPGHAMDGCGGAFESAAMISVIGYALSDLQAGATLEDLRREAIAKVLDNAQHPPQSTSATSNLYQTCKAKAWGDIVNAIDWRFPS